MTSVQGVLITHKLHCMRGKLFVHVSRREWEDDSSKLGQGFDITSVMGLHSDETLRNARALYDTLMGVNAPMPEAPRNEQRRDRVNLVDICIFVSISVLSHLFLLGSRCWQERLRQARATRQRSADPAVVAWSAACYVMNCVLGIHRPPKKPRLMDMKDVKCFNCNKKGHFARDCPDKAPRDPR